MELVGRRLLPVHRWLVPSFGGLFTTGTSIQALLIRWRR
jgi:hypothetical protein